MLSISFFRASLSMLASGRQRNRLILRSRIKKASRYARLYLLRRIPHCCWICDAPMSRQWLSGPNRAHFLGGVIADGEDKIELGRVLLSKFIPTLAAKTVPGHMGSFELSERFRPDCA